jgi:hypothetical protein
MKNDQNFPNNLTLKKNLNKYEIVKIYRPLVESIFHLEK